MVVRARQVFQFFIQITWFLRNKRALSKVKYQIFHYLISIIKSQKELVCKRQFYINQASNLRDTSKVIKVVDQ